MNKPDPIEEAIIHSAKHTGIWPDELSESLINGNMERIYLDVKSLKSEIKKLINDAYEKGYQKGAHND